MSDLQSLLTAGASDVLSTLGTSGRLSRNGTTYWTGTTAVVESSGGLQLEDGGGYVTVGAYAAVPDSAPRPQPGDRLLISSRVYQVTGVTHSEFDTLWHLDLSQLC